MDCDRTPVADIGYVTDIGQNIGWPVVSSPDATWEAPYSARFLDGASAPGS